MVCSEKCEMEGVIIGLEMSAEYFRDTVLWRMEISLRFAYFSVRADGK